MVIPMLREAFWTDQCKMALQIRVYYFYPLLGYIGTATFEGMK